MSFLLFLLALASVESSCDHLAVGDNGDAVGIFQVHRIVVEDVNRIIGQQRYSAADRYDPKACVEMAFIYCSYYGATERLGHKANARDLFLMWNGGPNFHHYPNAPAAQAYMDCVEGCLMAIDPTANTLAPVDIRLSTADWKQLGAKFGF